jgi:hypothetical protein
MNLILILLCRGSGGQARKATDDRSLRVRQQGPAVQLGENERRRECEKERMARVVPGFSIFDAWGAVHGDVSEIGQRLVRDWSEIGQWGNLAISANSFVSCSPAGTCRPGTRG